MKKWTLTNIDGDGTEVKQYFDTREEAEREAEWTFGRLEFLEVEDEEQEKKMCKVIAVAKYLLVNTLRTGPMVSSVMEESKKNSWNDKRPTRATLSKLVKAKADTAKVIKVLEMLAGMCSLVKNAATPLAKICGWVRSVGTMPSLAT